MTGFASGVMEGIQGSASSDYMRALGEKVQMDTALKKRFIQNMQQMGQGPAQDPADQMTSTGLQLIRAGLFKQGADLVNKGSMMESRKAAAQVAQQRAQNLQLDRQITQVGLVASVYENVHDQLSFDSANAYLARMGIKSPAMGMKYSPDLVAYLRQQAVSVGKQLELKARQNSLDERKRMDDFRMKDADRRAALARTKEDERKKNQGVSGKHGSIMPPTQLLKSAGSIISKDYVVPTVDELNVQQFELAEDALALRQKNPSLRIDEALAQAYLKAKAAGKYNGYTPMHNKQAAAEDSGTPPLPPGLVAGPAPGGE
jgi:hypothetical protein